MRLLNTSRWAQQRAKGFRHFVFVTGIFGVGLPVVVLVVLIDWITFSRDPLLSGYPGFQRSIGLLSLLLIVVGAPVFGVVWGFLTWKANEWLFRRYTAPASGAVGA